MKKLVFSIVFILSFGVLEASIRFALKNNSIRSINLHIPGVMNPGLSPFSISYVDLQPGQEIFLIKNEKKYLLLRVNESLKDKKVNVNKLVKKLSKEK